VLAWLSVWSEVQTIGIWSSWCRCQPIISYSSKIQNGLPFWCRLTQVVLEKMLLNGCSSSSSNNFYNCCLLFIVPFSALTQMVGWQEGHPARKNSIPLTWEVLCWNKWKRRSQGETSWPRFTQKKLPLDGSSSSSISSSTLVVYCSCLINWLPVHYFNARVGSGAVSKSVSV